MNCYLNKPTKLVNNLEWLHGSFPSCGCDLIRSSSGDVPSGDALSAAWCRRACNRLDLMDQFRTCHVLSIGRNRNWATYILVPREWNLRKDGDDAVGCRDSDVSSPLPSEDVDWRRSLRIQPTWTSKNITSLCIRYNISSIDWIFFLFSI